METGSIITIPRMSENPIIIPLNCERSVVTNLGTATALVDTLFLNHMREFGFHQNNHCMQRYLGSFHYMLRCRNTAPYYHRNMCSCNRTDQRANKLKLALVLHDKWCYEIWQASSCYHIFFTSYRFSPVIFVFVMCFIFITRKRILTCKFMAQK